MAPGATSGPASEDTPSSWTPNRPNILITGTPGVGKTTLAKQLADELGLRHIDVGEFARDRNHLAEHDPQHDAHYLHEDAVLDDLEPTMTDGAVIIDHHSCDWFPERWFQMLIVLRASTEPLYDRLEARRYANTKITENIQAEIMQVVLDEAISSYPRLQVIELINDNEHDQQRNITQIKRAWNTLNSDSNPEQDQVDGHPL